VGLRGAQGGEAAQPGDVVGIGPLGGQRCAVATERAVVVGEVAQLAEPDPGEAHQQRGATPSWGPRTNDPPPRPRLVRDETVVAQGAEPS
jgi:hypothetical protein